MKYLDHQLNNLAGVRDCHIEPDWILLWPSCVKKKTSSGEE
ncbi:MAG: type II toxin-antitoxin system YafQ family toxin [Spirochaetales bacterium]|nr:type II toxin-antitoxin system YafQ family toxin [Spirochaetales bacterium]